MKVNPAKMVVVWGDENIFSSSIQHILATKIDWKVVFVSNLEDCESLILPFENKTSDIVIIHQADKIEFTNLAIQLLQKVANIRVVTISLDNNVMNIYDKHSLLVKEASDLITAIENEAKPQNISIHPSRR
jgi:DNA-binding NarL/FixJ family response regulator